MNYKMMGRFLALIMAVEGVFMLPALAISLADGTDHVTRSFLITLGAIVLFAGLLSFFCRKAYKGFFAKEGLFCVGVSWIAMSVFGCLPAFLSGEIPNFVDALFE